MKDDELEDLLRRVRPAGPPPELRARIVRSSGAISARRVQRTWPWAAAAAALLVATLALHQAARLGAASAIDLSTPRDETVEALADMFGGDREARAIAELMIATDQARSERNGIGTSPDVAAEPR
jgi:hypothetical protein